MHAYLRGREGTAARLAGGLVGRTLVSDRAHLQVIDFFTDEAAGDAADVFRDLRAETREAQERGLGLLDAVCATDEDWETAETVASYVVQLAYDDYTDVLAGTGVGSTPIR
jgi:hypothetical protein